MPPPPPSGQITLSAVREPSFAKAPKSLNSTRWPPSQAELSGWNLAVALPPGKDQQPGTPVARPADPPHRRIDRSQARRRQLSADATANGSAVRADGEFSLPNLRSAFSGEKPAAPNALAKLLGAFYPIPRRSTSPGCPALADAGSTFRGAVSPVTALVREGLGEVFDISFESGQEIRGPRPLRAAVSGARAKPRVERRLCSFFDDRFADGSGTITLRCSTRSLPGTRPTSPASRPPPAHTFAADPIDSAPSPTAPRTLTGRALQRRGSPPGQTMVPQDRRAAACVTSP